MKFRLQKIVYNKKLRLVFYNYLRTQPKSEGVNYMGIAITPLERPIHIGKRLAKNRFLIQPMECIDGDLRGRFSESTLQRYENLFRGGAGVVVMEAITLQYESRARRNQLLLDVDDPDNRDQWERFLFPKTDAVPRYAPDRATASQR